jgi:hypothetical protein
MTITIIHALDCYGLATDATLLTLEVVFKQHWLASEQSNIAIACKTSRSKDMQAT